MKDNKINIMMILSNIITKFRILKKNFHPSILDEIEDDIKQLRKEIEDD